MTKKYIADIFEAGVKVSGNYSSLEADGPVLYGTATRWDDLRIAANQTTANGSNPPSIAVFKTDGSASPGATKALEFISQTTGNGNIPDNGVYDWSTNHSIDFWYKPEVGVTLYSAIIGKAGVWELSHWGSDYLAISYSAMGFQTTSIQVNVGAWNHIAITYQANLVQVYINNQFAAQISNAGTPSNNTNDIILNDDETLMAFDELVFWDKTLSVSDISTRYNSGAGTSLLGSESNVVGLWKLDSSSGSTMTDSHSTGNDGSITGTENTDFEWIGGHVGAAATGSLGVFAYYFSPTTRNEVFFNVQMPHAWKEGTDIHPHVHWFPAISGAPGQRVQWGMEYTWANLGTVFSNTTIISGNIASPSGLYFQESQHLLTSLGEINGSGQTLSSMLVCRLFRDAEDSADSYPGFVGFLEFDFHYEIDTMGSQEEYSKHGGINI